MTGYPEIVGRIAELAKLPADVTPHTFRHSFASLAADMGYSEPTIAALIGHAGRSMNKPLCPQCRCRVACGRGCGGDLHFGINGRATPHGTSSSAAAWSVSGRMGRPLPPDPDAPYDAAAQQCAKSRVNMCRASSISTRRRQGGRFPVRDFNFLWPRQFYPLFSRIW